ncbi:MAG TPA: YkgJ family cysteine cluster protein [Candidatus Binatia bacterium]|nr:YkgJ family cysteine cluster protein [Candidatus Binatia bacterium]
MPSEKEISAKTINVKAELAGPDWQLQTTMSVPTEPIRLKEMLPLFFSFADAVMSAAANGVEQSGEKISCKKGCGACCRQLVPISEPEAHWIAELVDRLPIQKKVEIRDRFAESRRRLAESGLLDKLLDTKSWGEGEGWSIAMSYFRLGIPCPFLENEDCSIHRDRPIKCREYLVTSPAANCRQPSANNITMVDLPFQMWTAMARLENTSATGEKVPWVPLILALECADAHAQEPEPRAGHEVLREFFDRLTGRGVSQEKIDSASEANSA